MERYTAMYPRGQPGLQDDPVMAYMNDLRATHASPSSAIAQRAPQAPARTRPTRECFICMAPDLSSSSESELAPRHRRSASSPP
jgi:hypothetical protein